MEAVMSSDHNDSLVSSSDPFLSSASGFKNNNSAHLAPGSKASPSSSTAPMDSDTNGYDDDMGGSSAAAAAAETVLRESTGSSSRPVVTYNDMFPSLPTAPAAAPIVSASWRPAIVAKKAPVVAAPISSGKGGRGSSSSANKAQPVSLEFSSRMQIHPTELETLPTGTRQDVIKGVMSYTNTVIEMQTNREGVITLLVQGKQPDVINAKRRISQRLMKQVEIKINVPKDYHRFLIGQGGKVRQEMEAKTNARIQIPKAEEETEDILVSGHLGAVQAARVEIFNIVSERTNVGSETLIIDKLYHVFLLNSDRLRQFQETSTVKIKFGTETNPDEVQISGKLQEVADAAALIDEIYGEKKRTTKSVSVGVNKKQHRFVIGSKGVNIQEILKATGCAIFVPQSSDPSDSITIVGEDSMILKALEMVMEKARSVSIDELPVSNATYQRYLSSSRGKQRLRDFEKDTKCQITFNGTAVEVQGPPEEVPRVRPLVTDFIKGLKLLTFDEIQIASELIKFVIGKDGQNIKKMKAEHDVEVIVPTLSDDSSVGASESIETILLAGQKDKVKVVKDLLQKTVKEMANFVTETLQVDAKFHSAIIGAKGATIKKISEKYENVTIKVGNDSANPNAIIVRGPKADVEAAVKEINVIVEEARHFEVMNSFTEEIMVEQKYLKYVVGREGAAINQLRTAHSVRVDIEEPKSASSSTTTDKAAKDDKSKDDKTKKGDKKKTEAAPSEKAAPAKESSEKQKVIIRGTKKGVADAKKELLAKLQEVIEGGGYVSEDITIDPKYHGSMIGPKGQYVNSLMDRLNVVVKFPSSETGSNIVSIKGLQKAVDKAKAELLEVLAFEMDRNYSEDISVIQVVLHELFGKNENRKSQALMKILQATNTRADSAEDKPNTVHISGHKKDVKSAVPQIKDLIKALTDRVTEELSIDHKHFPGLIGRKGARVQEMSERHNNVNIRFSEDKDVVLLQGPSKDVAAAKEEILAAVSAAAKEEENAVTVTLNIPKKEQSAIREFARSLQGSHKVRVTFGKEGEEADTVTLSGSAEACAEAQQLLQANPATSESVVIPSSQRGKLLGQGHIRTISQKYFVNIKLPPQNAPDDATTIVGGKDLVEKAKGEILALLAESGGDSNGEGRVKEELTIDRALHGAIIGRSGSTIKAIMSKTNARIDLPKDSDVIILRGRQSEVDDAKHEILTIVGQQQSQQVVKVRVAPRFYGAIIGKGGSKLRSLQSDFEVQINVPSSNSKSDLIEIKGQRDDCNACKEEIMRIIEDEMEENEEVEDGEIAEDVRPPPQQRTSSAPKKTTPKQEVDEAFFAPPPGQSGSNVRSTSNGVWGTGRAHN